MSYLRTGECNKCGECCGFPRKTDHGQVNAWPLDWPLSVANWSEKDKDEKLGVFRITGHIDYAGNHITAKHHFPWIWVKDHGLCKRLSDKEGHTSWDQRCPFLLDKQEDGTVPCGIYGTNFHDIWVNFCNRVPPVRFETLEALQNWQRNCPSCSFVYTEE